MNPEVGKCEEVYKVCWGRILIFEEGKGISWLLGRISSEEFLKEYQDLTKGVVGKNIKL